MATFTSRHTLITFEDATGYTVEFAPGDLEINLPEPVPLGPSLDRLTDFLEGNEPFVPLARNPAPGVFTGGDLTFTANIVGDVDFSGLIDFLSRAPVIEPHTITREQYRLLDRLCRIFRRAAWGIDDRGGLLVLVAQTDLQLAGLGMDLYPAPLAWLLAALPS